MVSDSAGVSIVTFLELPGLDDPAYRWELRPTRSIPTERDGSPIIYEPESLTRLEDGTLVIADLGDVPLAVIDPVGDSVARRFGRRGSGPGEVQGATPFAGTDGTVWIADGQNARSTRFTLQGDLVSSSRWRLQTEGGFATIRPSGGGLVAQRFWVVNTGTPQRMLVDSLAWVDLESGEMENFVPVPRGLDDRNPSPVPFHERQIWTVLSPERGAVIGRTHQPVLRHFSTTGDLVLELRLPLSTRPISDSDRAGILEELFGITEGLLMEMETAPDVGSHYPLTTALYSVNDTTFAMYQSARIRAREDTPLPEGRTVWRLFTVSGRYAGTLWFPEDFGLPIWVGGGHLVGVTRNALGVATIQEYEIAPPAGLFP